MTGPTPSASRRGWWRLPRGVLLALFACVALLALAWAALAIYFMPWFTAPVRVVLTVAFGAFGAWAIWGTRRRAARLALCLLYAAVLVAWSFVKPSQDREWRADVGVMPRATIDGDVVRLTGVRDFDYRTRDDFAVRYVEREVRLSKLTGVDFFISYWMPGPIGHTFLSFMFEDAPPLTVSIETRPESHEGYSPLASLFKQYELIYVVGEERDLVGVRTNHRAEDVYVFRLLVPPEAARDLFRVYLERINDLADEPEFYHLLSNSCTVNIVRYANRVGRAGNVDLRHYFNGWIDRYFYDAQLVQAPLPFAEFRRRSRVDPTVPADAGIDEFTRRIRATVPGMADQPRPLE